MSRKRILRKGSIPKITWIDRVTRKKSQKGKGGKKLSELSKPYHLNRLTRRSNRLQTEIESTHIPEVYGSEFGFGASIGGRRVNITTGNGALAVATFKYYIATNSAMIPEAGKGANLLMEKGMPVNALNLTSLWKEWQGQIVGQ